MGNYIFREEWGSKRVMMGFLLGMALSGYWVFVFLRYAGDLGEPVNILEAFIVTAHHQKNMLFLPLGWLLAVSDAPFIKGNTYLVLYRGSRKKWSAGALYYLMLQAFLYVFGIAALSVAAGSCSGFYDDMWSSPVYGLAVDVTGIWGVKYKISFPWANVMRHMTVPQAFGITFLFLYLYLVFLGVLLYACNLLLKETYGILIVFGIQVSGYLLQQDGMYGVSLFAKSMPGYSIDGGGGEWKTVFLFVGIIVFLSLISLWIIRYVDLKEAAGEE